MSHLTLDLHIEELRNLMRKFFQEKLLNWIELGGTTNALPKYMLSLGQLRASMEKLHGLSMKTIVSPLYKLVVELTQAKTDEDLKWCIDTLEFLRLNQSLLQESPEHVYSSTIVFTPHENMVYKQYESRLSAGLPAIVLGQVAPGSRSTVLRGHDGVVTRISYSEAGDLLVSAAVEQYGQKGEVMVWDVQTGAQLMGFRLEGLSMSCYGVSFLPGNKTVVSVWEGTDGPYNRQLYRLDCETGTLVCPPQTLPEADDLGCIAWSPKMTHMLCGKWDGRMYRLSLENMAMVGEMVKAHDEKINSLSFSHDGLAVVSASPDGTFKTWTVGSRDLTGPNHAEKPNGLEIYGAVFCPTDSSLLGVTVGEALQIYNVASGAVDLDFGVVNGFSQIVYSPDGKYIATLGYDQRNLNLSKCNNTDAVGMRLETGHTLRMATLAFSPDQKHVATGSEDQTLRIHDLGDINSKSEATGHLGTVRRMAFTSDCKWLASSDEEQFICIWDMGTGKLAGEPIKTDMRRQNVIAYSSDGSTVASASMSDDIALWDVKTHAKLPVELKLGYSTAGDQPLEIHAMVISPDDCTLAIMARGYFEDAERELLILKKLQEPSSTALTVDSDLQLDINTFTLAYHPSGDYICADGRAWDVGVNPPAPVTGEKLGAILKETFPIFHDFAYEQSPLPTVSFGSNNRRSFCIPPDLNVYVFSVYEHLLALGSEDGRVTVLDFTHLFTPEETDLLSRIRGSLSCGTL